MKTNRFFYGFRFLSGRKTTTGEPNARTGAFSIAGEAACFSSAQDRDAWVDKEDCSLPSGMGGGIRQAVSIKELRGLSAGMNGEEFAEFVSDLKREAGSA